MNAKIDWEGKKKIDKIEIEGKMYKFKQKNTNRINRDLLSFTTTFNYKSYFQLFQLTFFKEKSVLNKESFYNDI